jgi:hypothetical protein
MSEFNIGDRVRIRPENDAYDNLEGTILSIAGDYEVLFDEPVVGELNPAHFTSSDLLYIDRTDRTWPTTPQTALAPGDRVRIRDGFAYQGQEGIVIESRSTTYAPGLRTWVEIPNHSAMHWGTEALELIDSAAPNSRNTWSKP